MQPWTKPWMTIGLVALSVAACGQAGAGLATEADPAAMPPMGQFAPPPGPEAPRAVQPLSNTAAAITGAATFGPDAYRFALGQTYEIKPEAKVAAALAWSSRGKSWADLLGVDHGGEVELVRVTTQIIYRGKARNGGLCGGEAPVRWIAVARSGEDVGAEVRMAAFSGERPPGPMGRDEDLCGTYNYAAGN